MSSYGQFAAVYDRLMADMPYLEWLRFAGECWERYGKPSTIVDLGCGTGSIAIPLAASGFNVYAIDLSSDMLTVGRDKWEQSPQRAARPRAGTIQWLQQDMCEWELPEPADAVISFCDCINYLTESEDVEAAFRATYEGLRPGGVFLFDAHARRTLERYAEEQPFVLDEDDIAYIWTSDYDAERREIEHNLSIFVREGQDRSAPYRRIEETHVQRAYEPQWLQDALLRAGFSRVEMFADFKLEPAGEGAERLFFAAVK